MPQALASKLVFSYESYASNSFLKADFDSDLRIMDYQIVMIQCNNIDRVIPIETKTGNGRTYFYYNITSKLSLAFFLRRRRLKRAEFIKILADTAKTLTECAGYLLCDTSFLIDPEYIFVNPENLELSFIYIPVSVEENISDSYKLYVAQLILDHANFEEDGDNFLQRILNETKKDNFNLRSFRAFLNSLLIEGGYGEDSLSVKQKEINTDLGVKQGQKPEYNAAAKTVGKSEGRYNKAERKADVRFESKADNRSYTWNQIIFIIVTLLLQIVLTALILLGFRYLSGTGSDPASSTAGLVIIALAVDLLAIKNLNKFRLKEKGTGLENNEKIKDYAKNYLNSLKIDNFTNCETDRSNSGEINIGRGPSREEQAPVKSQTSGRTVLLGYSNPGMPRLKSRKPEEYTDIPVDKNELVIGRLAGQVDIILDNKAVGKVHALISKQNGSYFIKDLNSMNGTYINDLRIESNMDTEIKANDRVMLANSEYVFVTA